MRVLCSQRQEEQYLEGEEFNILLNMAAADTNFFHFQNLTLK